MKKDSIQKLFSLKSVFAVVVLSMVAVLFACELRDEEPAMTEEQIEIKEAVENTNAQLKTVTGDVFFVVEEMPEFPKGEFEKSEQALRMFLATNIKYPPEAQQAGVFGRAYISFIVADDGKIKDVKVARSSGHSILDDEAVRVVSSMPQWTPGKQSGKAVNVSFTVPINFQLNDGDNVKESSDKKIKLDTEEEKAAFIEKMKENGFEVEFNEDGTFNLIHTKGTATPIASK